MKRNTTISAKISEEEMREIKQFKINPTNTIRKAVQEEIRKAKNKELINKMEKIMPIISKLKLDEIAMDIREDRNR